MATVVNGATVLASPHRLAFLTGSVNLVLLAAWWLLQLSGLYFATPLPPQTALPAVLLHAPVFLYLIFPPFIFGFLLTVFPRWMGYPDLGPREFGPVAVAQAAAALLVHGGLWAGADSLLLAGLAVAALGWAFAIFVLAAVVRRNRQDSRPACWHAISALAALVLGLAGLIMSASFMLLYDARFWNAGNTVGINGFLLPVFLTVAHRMVPFFAANVVKEYVRWRPDWLLLALWVLLLCKLAGELAEAQILILASCIALALLTGLIAFRWWPRGPAPGLLKVLIWGFAWAPFGFALSATSAAGADIGRAPGHALLIGFAASLLVGMVTRVTQGHSGRPLQMTMIAWLAFAAVQLSAIARMIAAFHGERGDWLVAAGVLLLGGTLPWAGRNARIYCARRDDGKAG